MVKPRYILTAKRIEPVTKLEKIRVEGAEGFLVILSNQSAAVSDSNCSYNDILVYIHSTAVKTNNLK